MQNMSINMTNNMSSPVSICQICEGYIFDILVILAICMDPPLRMFKKDNDNDDVAPPSQHSASGSAESSSDSCPSNALSFHPKITSAIFFEMVIISIQSSVFKTTIQNLIIKCLLLEVLLLI